MNNLVRVSLNYNDDEIAEILFEHATEALKKSNIVVDDYYDFDGNLLTLDVTYAGK